VYQPLKYHLVTESYSLLRRWQHFHTIFLPAITTSCAPNYHCDIATDAIVKKAHCHNLPSPPPPPPPLPPPPPPALPNFCSNTNDHRCTISITTTAQSSLHIIHRNYQNSHHLRSINLSSSHHRTYIRNHGNLQKRLRNDAQLNRKCIHKDTFERKLHIWPMLEFGCQTEESLIWSTLWCWLFAVESFETVMFAFLIYWNVTASIKLLKNTFLSIAQNQILTSDTLNADLQKG